MRTLLSRSKKSFSEIRVLITELSRLLLPVDSKPLFIVFSTFLFEENEWL